KEVGVKFEHVSAPQPSDIARAAGLDAAEAILRVSDSVIPVFKSAAEDLLNTSGLSPVELLAKALAKSIGYTQIKQRSLLTSMENYATLLLDPGRPIYNPSFAYGNGGEVRLVVVNALPQLQEREQQSRVRYADNARGNGYDNRKGGGGRGNSNAVGFSRGGRTGLSDRRNDRFSRGPAGGSRGRGAYRKW
nr:DEAD-box ATP-dependent RNA helicase 7 [Tanacetum cinerariifolium]